MLEGNEKLTECQAWWLSCVCVPSLEQPRPFLCPLLQIIIPSKSKDLLLRPSMHWMGRVAGPVAALMFASDSSKADMPVCQGWLVSAAESIFILLLPASQGYSSLLAGMRSLLHIQLRAKRIIYAYVDGAAYVSSPLLVLLAGRPYVPKSSSSRYESNL